MEATEAIFAQVLVAIAADSGLSNSSTSITAPYLRQIVRVGDSQELSLNDLPAVAVDITTFSRNPIGATTECFEAVVTFIVYAYRDPGQGGLAVVGSSAVRANLDVVLARLMSVFDNATLTSLTDTDDNTRKWYFPPMWRVHLGTPQATSRAIRQSVSYKLYVNKGTV